MDAIAGTQPYRRGMSNPLTVFAPGRPRVVRAAAIAAACTAAGAATVFVADDRSATQVRSSAQPSAPVVASRYFDTEANKIASMRALRRHIAGQRAQREAKRPRRQRP